MSMMQGGQTSNLCMICKLVFFPKPADAVLSPDINSTLNPGELISFSCTVPCAYQIQWYIHGLLPVVRVQSTSECHSYGLANNHTQALDITVTENEYTVQCAAFSEVTRYENNTSPRMCSSSLVYLQGKHDYARAIFHTILVDYITPNVPLCCHSEACASSNIAWYFI